MSLRRLWPAENHRNRRPRFPYRGAVPLLGLAAAVVLVTIWCALPPRTQPAHPPKEIEKPANPPLPAPAPEKISEEPAPPEASEAGEADACPKGCTVPKPGCDIKGNIAVDDGEHIYHLPGQRWYDKTVISPEKGERWFCTEEEAEANGWRRAKV